MSSTPQLAALAGLEPAVVWSHFAGLAAVPRPSKKEERVREWVLGLARQRGWATRSDSVGNIVLDVPATPGCEKAPLLALQSHLDMVCEKNADVTFDFDAQGIVLKVVGDEVRAAGTTLGADNGIGVAAMLAVAASPDLRHGPLELLFTIDEETGLTGATAISPTLLKARRLINLDSEEDDILYIGCAGGRTSSLRLTAATSPITPTEACVAILVTGLRGGHSGADIHEGRANSNKLLVQTIARLRVPFRLAKFEGGNKHNAIPRESTAHLFVQQRDAASVKAVVEAMQKEALARYGDVDPGVRVCMSDTKAPPTAFGVEDSRRAIDLLAAVPDGVLGLSRAVPGLVETSNNLAVVSWESEGQSQAGIRIIASSRSSSAPALTAVCEQIAALGRLAGFAVETADGYPGWQPDPKSKLLEVCRAVYEREFSEKPHVTAIHAGLECGVIGERIGGMDMISFGPTIKGVHSPDENVSIRSVQKFWRYLKSVLAALATA